MSISASDIEKFKIWLRAHGARFDKIDWPSSATESGIRGGVALEDIETNEPMITIPSKLMMTPESAFSDPDVGEIFTANADLLADDELLLTIYLMHEISKGEDSFYYPFIKILPDPGSISKWNEHELDELQDEWLKLRAQKKHSQTKQMYDSLLSALNGRCPDFFTPEVYSLEKFYFAFDTVQARAYGRRLPRISLVPFADCLNHNNVNTMYSFKDSEIEEVAHNGSNGTEKLFCLYPSGSTSYTKGKEVFISYGRLPNYHLLLDYGFCMMNNEWDEVRVLRLYGEYRTKKLRIRKNYALENVSTVSNFQPPEYQNNSNCQDLAYFRVIEAGSLELMSFEVAKKEETWSLTKNPCAIERPMNLINERAALRRFAAVLTSHLTDALPTSEEEDSVQLSFLRDEMLPASCDDDGEGAAADDSASDSKWRLLCSLTYRITRKRILKNTILLLEVLGDWIDDIIASRAEGSILARTPAKPVEMYDSISQLYSQGSSCVTMAYLESVYDIEAHMLESVEKKSEMNTISLSIPALIPAVSSMLL